MERLNRELEKCDGGTNQRDMQMKATILAKLPKRRYESVIITTLNTVVGTWTCSSEPEILLHCTRPPVHHSPGNTTCNKYFTCNIFFELRTPDIAVCTCIIIYYNVSFISCRHKLYYMYNIIVRVQIYYLYYKIVRVQSDHTCTIKWYMHKVCYMYHSMYVMITICYRTDTFYDTSTFLVKLYFLFYIGVPFCYELIHFCLQHILHECKCNCGAIVITIR